MTKATTKVMSVEYDGDTEKLMEELKEFFGVKTKAAVIQRSLAIARAARKYSDDDKTLSVIDPSTNMQVGVPLR